MLIPFSKIIESNSLFEQEHQLSMCGKIFGPELFLCHMFEYAIILVECPIVGIELSHVINLIVLRPYGHLEDCCVVRDS